MPRKPPVAMRRPGGIYDPADRPKLRALQDDPESYPRPGTSWRSPPRTEGEKHAERQAWRSPGTEEQRIARFNEAREAFSGVRMSRGRGIGRERRRNGRRKGGR